MNHRGPNLLGIVGRKVASEGNYNNYSAQALYKDTIWDEENLDTFLANPKRFIPGTRMVFDGLKNATERKGICHNKSIVQPNLKAKEGLRHMIVVACCYINKIVLGHNVRFLNSLL